MLTASALCQPGGCLRGVTRPGIDLLSPDVLVLIFDCIVGCLNPNTIISIRISLYILLYPLAYVYRSCIIDAGKFKQYSSGVGG